MSDSEITIEEAIRISEAVQKHKAEAWDAGLVVGMSELAMRCCVSTLVLKAATEEGLKKNPFRK